jgi:parallel beta-helix repeat protein
LEESNMKRSNEVIVSACVMLASCSGGAGTEPTRVDSAAVTTMSAVDAGADPGSATAASGAKVTKVSGLPVACGADLQTAIDDNPGGTTFVLAANCTYRLTTPVFPKSHDVFSGPESCAPPTTPCTTVVSGSVVIGPLATFDGTNWRVTGQTQHGAAGDYPCEAGWSGCNYPEDLWFDGVPYQHLGGTTLQTIGTGQWWFDYTNHVIYFHDDPKGHLVETSVARAFAIGPSTHSSSYTDPANDVTFQYLTIEEFAAPITQGTIWPAFGSDATQQSSGLDWVVKDCEMWGNHSEPVHAAYGLHILDNYSHDNGQVGVGGGVDPDDNLKPSGLLVQGNLVTNNNYAHVDPGFGAGGMKFGRTIDAVVKNNTVKDNGGTGIHFDVSSVSPVIEGNTVVDNLADGIRFEIGLVSATFRNNVTRGNGSSLGPSTDMTSAGSSTGLNAYCNVVEITAMAHENAMIVVASNRGDNTTGPPELGAYYTSTGNSFHHNTVIWAAGTTGHTGYLQDDAANQPGFFQKNTPPDYNTYHLPSLSDTQFIYDNDNSQLNRPKTFAQYQSAGADVHGTADTNYTSGYPAISIASPADGSSSSGESTIQADASDLSGIRKVELYDNWDLEQTLTTSSYAFKWSGSTGTHVLAAMAYSVAGIRACHAITVTVP